MAKIQFQFTLLKCPDFCSLNKMSGFVFTIKCPDFCSLWIVRISVHFLLRVTVDPRSGSFRRVIKKNEKLAQSYRSHQIKEMKSYIHFWGVTAGRENKKTFLSWSYIIQLTVSISLRLQTCNSPKISFYWIVCGPPKNIKEKGPRPLMKYDHLWARRKLGETQFFSHLN